MYDIAMHIDSIATTKKKNYKEIPQSSEIYKRDIDDSAEKKK